MPPSRTSIADRSPDAMSTPAPAGRPVRLIDWQPSLQPALEACFQADRADARRRTLVATGLAWPLVYAGFLPIDAAMVPDLLPAALALRLGVFLPLALLAVLALRLEQPPLRRETLSAAVAALAVALHCGLGAASQAPTAHFHLAGLAVLLLYAVSVQRLRFRLSLALSLGVQIGAAASALMLGTPLQIAAPVLLLTLSAAIFALYAAYVLERQARETYALQLDEARLRERVAQAADKLEQLTRLDGLTGLANRRHLREYLDQVWARAQRDGTPLAALMIDIDAFKLYNDRYGHPAGDRCLREVAQAVQATLRRPGDLIARYGGEEFIAVLARTTPDMAERVARRVCETVLRLGLPHEASPTAPVVTVSVGAACVQPLEGLTPDDLIAAADEALYQAKRAGRNRVWLAPALHAAQPGIASDDAAPDGAAAEPARSQACTPPPAPLPGGLS
ncbi:MAG: GGDEF domain-containing protein [Burkholderiales bacterium]|nr:GGDEF domain-containing protein [Burkholderiales bacterium]